MPKLYYNAVAFEFLILQFPFLIASVLSFFSAFISHVTHVSNWNLL